MSGISLDTHPLPHCTECGWTHPTHIIEGGARDAFWLHPGLFYATGPVDWRVYPEFRCGCRIVHEAREKGLIDEACAGR